MQDQNSQVKVRRNRDNERGAALVMVLLISALLLVALSALIMEASMNTANVTDATAEEQAYYAAESGIQSVINVLRHNTAPNPLIDPTKTPYPPSPNADPANRIDYVKALRIATSNATTPTVADCGSANPPLDCVTRLSRWLRYGNNAGFPDRIVLGDPTSYTENGGLAFKVTVSDPDNASGIITYQTNSNWTAATTATNVVTVVSKNVITVLDTTTGNTLKVEYVAANPYTRNVSSGIANTEFGKFVLTGSGPTFATNGVNITSGIRFAIRVQLTQPYGGIKYLRGYLEKGNIKPGSVGTSRLFFDSRDYIIFGSAVRARRDISDRIRNHARSSGGGDIGRDLDHRNHNLARAGSDIDTLNRVRTSRRTQGTGSNSTKELLQRTRRAFASHIDRPALHPCWSVQPNPAADTVHAAELRVQPGNVLGNHLQR